MQSNRERYSLVYRWLLVVPFLLFVSCSEKKQALKPFNPQPPEIVSQKPESPPGSLFTEVTSTNLFSDDKAYQVGDVITIKVIENISGSGSANSQSGRDTSVEYDFPSPTLMGKPLINKTPIAGAKAGSKNSFKGTGKTDRKARLVATISARVVKVYPNGNLFIVGKKIIKINEDEQILRISGIVEPTYIDQDNSILSSKISDMYIEYNGKGFIADNQRPGWLAQFLAKIWPF
ncbi:flagellar L-ring protein precursor FlgH [Persephonella hydrogeniphila]|uniref:Flagellar L-ring protein n=1 Tax=Persephonella hydrogeniphila TaxID=198703 RepID=A0A285NFS6_9AQUI|nr:flagellar basal body L-ring protein FlgH [Persephonella hydrogeniphila]SNZ08128.1 flagellar L-ring protein precursor FlgH [Persephonella hydrogeniphila]